MKRVFKTTLAGVLSLVLATGILPASVQAQVSLKLEVNRQVIASEPPAQLMNGRVMVPLRAVSEALGTPIHWDAGKRAILVNTSSATVPAAGSKRIAVWVNGNRLTLDTPPVLRNGRVLIGVRLLAEALGAQVQWNSPARTVQITTNTNVLNRLEVSALQSISFVDSPEWSFSRMYTTPSQDPLQKQMDGFLFRMLALLKQGQPAELGQVPPVEERMDIMVGQWKDADGQVQSQGYFRLELAGNYAIIDWPGQPKMVLRLPDNGLKSGLAALRQLMPDTIPERAMTISKLPEANFVSKPLNVSVMEHQFTGSPGSVVVLPESAGYLAVSWNHSSYPATSSLWRSDDAVRWEPTSMELPPEFTMGAINVVPGEPNIWLLTDGRDGSIYRAEHSGGRMSAWEHVAQYGHPESNNNYAPYKFIPDKARPGRIYGMFYHDTIHPAADGVLVSEDHGRTWAMSGVNGDANLNFYFPSEPVVDPGKAGRIWVSGSMVHGMYSEAQLHSGGGLYVSEDAGRRWHRLSKLSEVHAAVRTPQGPLIVGIRKERDAQQQAITYLLTSTDGGFSWQERKLPGYLGDWRIHVDAASSRTMVAFAYDNEGFVVTRSDDGGATWSVPARTPTYGQVLYATPGLEQLVVWNNSSGFYTLNLGLGS